MIELFVKGDDDMLRTVAVVRSHETAFAVIRLYDVNVYWSWT